MEKSWMLSYAAIFDVMVGIIIFVIGGFMSFASLFFSNSLYFPVGISFLALILGVFALIEDYYTIKRRN